MTERLTTLAAVKEWLGIQGTSSDALLTRLIDSASQFVINWLNRDGFAARTYTQNFKGNGKCETLLRNWPVLSVLSVGVAGSAITASTIGNVGMPGTGYVLGDARNGPQSLELYGHSFYYRAPCQIVYRAGFETTQDYTILGDADDHAVPFTPTNGGVWTTNNSVTASEGTVFTQVKATPDVGQYSIDDWGVYTFADGDIGTTVTIDYAYVPWDLSQGVVEFIGESFRRRDRIGVLSKSLASQETVTFSDKDMNTAVRNALQPYQNVVPI